MAWEEIRKDDEHNVPRFLNRLLALGVEEQETPSLITLPSYLTRPLDYAKANGIFDEGVTDIKALAVSLAGAPQVVHTDKITGAETTHYTLAVESPTEAITFGRCRLDKTEKERCIF